MIEDAISQLRSFRSTNVFNPWRDTDAMDATAHAADERVDRLRRHFDCRPKIVLVGEAPGYQGCRFSGIPFTNEKLILDGEIPRVMSASRLSTRASPWSEPSATVVWQTLHELDLSEHAVLWNAFAWHPYSAGKPHSNRKPSRSELVAGAHVLRAVLAHFGGAEVVAIGKVAEATLASLSIRVSYSVRHPAFGGATEFRKQMRHRFAKTA